MHKTILTTMILMAFSIGSHASTQYNLDTSHSSVGFSVDHLMISKVSGRFDKYEGQFSFDEKTGKLNALTAKIDLDSVNTNEPKRDEHLRSADFFGVRDASKKIVEAKRWMTFSGGEATVKKGSPAKLEGKLTLNGVTKPVTLTLNYKGTVKDPWGNQKLGFEATGVVERKLFGLAWNKALETGGFVVGDKVTINIEGEATAVAAANK